MRILIDLAVILIELACGLFGFLLTMFNGIAGIAGGGHGTRHCCRRWRAGSWGAARHRGRRSGGSGSSHRRLVVNRTGTGSPVFPARMQGSWSGAGAPTAPRSCTPPSPAVLGGHSPFPCRSGGAELLSKADSSDDALRQVHEIDDFLDRIRDSRTGLIKFVDEFEDMLKNAQETAKNIATRTGATSRQTYSQLREITISAGEKFKLSYRQFVRSVLDQHVRKTVGQWLGMQFGSSSTWVGTSDFIAGLTKVSLSSGLVDSVFFLDNIPFQGARNIITIVKNIFKKIPGGMPLYTGGITAKLIGIAYYFVESCFWMIFSPMGFKGIFAALDQAGASTINPYSWEGYNALLG